VIDIKCTESGLRGERTLSQEFHISCRAYL